MSTRCNIHFNYGKTIKANIYRHSDGYPEGEHGVLANLQTFFIEVKKQTKDTRFDDPSYLAAKFIVWQADQNAKDYYSKVAIAPLNFVGLGVVIEDAPDGEFVYEVNCSKLDENGFPEVKVKDAVAN